MGGSIMVPVAHPASRKKIERRNKLVVKKNKRDVRKQVQHVLERKRRRLD